MCVCSCTLLGCSSGDRPKLCWKRMWGTKRSVLALPEGGLTHTLTLTYTHSDPRTKHLLSCSSVTIPEKHQVVMVVSVTLFSIRKKSSRFFSHIAFCLWGAGAASLTCLSKSCTHLLTMLVCSCFEKSHKLPLSSYEKKLKKQRSFP